MGTSTSPPRKARQTPLAPSDISVCWFRQRSTRIPGASAATGASAYNLATKSGEKSLGDVVSLISQFLAIGRPALVSSRRGWIDGGSGDSGAAGPGGVRALGLEGVSPGCRT